MKTWVLILKLYVLWLLIFVFSGVGYSAETIKSKPVPAAPDMKTILASDPFIKAQWVAEADRGPESGVSASSKPTENKNAKKTQPIKDAASEEGAIVPAGDYRPEKPTAIDGEDPGTTVEPTESVETKDLQTRQSASESANVQEAAPEISGQTSPPGGNAVTNTAEGEAEPLPETTAQNESSPPKVAEIETEFVRSLTQITVGHNDSNPLWSPSGKLIAFERSIGDKREIIIADKDGTIVQRIYFKASDGEEDMAFLFPGIVEEISYNSGITWSPDEKSIVFMSNAGSGNYDLYLWSELGKEDTVRLTENEEKDSHPHWSPQNNHLVFVSGRTGKADIFMMDLSTRKAAQLTNGKKTYLYPQWSPDGQKVAMIYGSNENHDIFVIGDISRPHETIKALTTWTHDDLRPVWSPDGTKIAFYSNYNLQDDPKEWSLVVVAADGSDPTEGDGLAAKVVATNVIPDIERGPAWMMDSNRIVYVKNDEQTFNPLYVVNVIEGNDLLIRTETKMNHDVICSSSGTLAFRAQVEQWDHIYIARLKQ